jgi:phosphate-selective porin OprO and OprP
MRVNIKRAALRASIVALLPFAQAALAQDAPASSNDELRREIDEQKQRLLVLERKLENQQEAIAAAVPTTPKITASASRFQIGSADGANFIRLRGTLFADSRVYGGSSAPETADTFLLRSVRPTFEGTFGNIYDFKFAPDFGSGRSTIVDAYIAARFNPGFVVTAGKFKPSVGLERLESESDLRFMERGLPTLLVPNRDLGLQVSGEFAGGAFAYQVGYWATSMAFPMARAATTSPPQTSKAIPPATMPRACSSNRSSTRTISAFEVWVSASAPRGRTSQAQRPSPICRPIVPRVS